MFLLLCVNQANAADTSKADVVFFVDASGSMADYINAVKENIISFAKQLVSDDVDTRFSIVAFKDNVGISLDQDGYYYLTSRSHDVVISDWTSNAEDVEKTLALVSADGGDETQTDALNRVFTSMTFRSDADKFGFLLTDEDTTVSSYDQSYTNQGEHFVTIDELIPKFKNINMPVSVISETLLKEHYTNLFANTGGVFVDITQGDFYKSMLDIAKWISEQSKIASEDRLPYAIIEGVPDEILNNVSGDDGETVLERIAKLAKISVDQINVITPLSIDLSLPREPTKAMREKANGEFIAKTDTLTLHSTFLKDGEDGYYLFLLNVPDEVLSMDLKVQDIKLWFAVPEDFAASQAGELKASFDPFTYFEITDLFGYKADNLAKKVLVLILGNTGKSLSMWILRILMFLAGCNAGVGIIGSGMIVSVGGFLIWKFFRRHS